MNEKLLKAHNKLVRFGGQMYRIIACQLGGRILADAEPVAGGDRINLVKTRSTLGKNLRNLVDMGLVS